MRFISRSGTVASMMVEYENVQIGVTKAMRSHQALLEATQLRDSDGSRSLHLLAFLILICMKQ